MEFSFYSGEIGYFKTGFHFRSPKMEILGGISDFQVDFDKIFTYFQQARKKIAEEEQEFKSKKQVPSTSTTQNSDGICVW